MFGNTRFHVNCFLALFLTISLISCGEDDIEGCTNPNANNYNSEANVDDGSCIISGCTDSDAENFNPNANSSSNDCIYARDKFLGSFLGSINCLIVDQFNAETTTVLFEADEENNNNLVVSLVAEDFTLPIQATVEGSTIMLFAEDFPFEVEVLGVNTEVLLDIEGEANINDTGDMIIGGFTATIKNANTGAEILKDSCTIEAEREG